MESPSSILSSVWSAPDAPSDEEIVVRVLDGDLALFEILMRRNNGRVYRAIRGVLRDEAEVEDAMQAAYLQAYTHLRSFRGGARFSTWLTRIALNEALGRLRHRRRHPEARLPDAEEDVVSIAAPPDATPESEATRRELAALLERAVEALPEHHRVVFMLRELEGMDTAETASALGVSEDVVKTRLSRAKAALRDELERLAGSAASEAFAFRAPRCDRVVAGVMAVLYARR